MWEVFPPDAMEALTQFEPAFEPEAKDVSLGTDEAVVTGRRIAARLPLPEKVAALVVKAAGAGTTKTALYQAMRPKPCAKELGAILDRLCREGRIEARRARIQGSGREGLRFFLRGCEQPTPGGVRKGVPWAGGVPLEDHGSL